MLSAIYELGSLNIKMENKSTDSLLELIVHDPNKGGNYPKVLAAVFEEVNKEQIIEYQYREISIEDLSKEKILQYLYRRGSSQGPDFTLSTKITEVEKTFKNKVLSWINKFKNYESNIIQSLCKGILNNQDKILFDLKERYEEINCTKDKIGCLFTIKILKDGNYFYIGDIKDFRDLLIKLVKEDYRKISQNNHICALCGKEKEEVFGNSISKVFPFYNLDKPGSIAGGFNEFLAWKNAPVCLECTLKLEEGRKFLEEKLKYKMGGQQYFLIPKFILGVNFKEEIVKTFFKYASKPSEQIHNFETIRRITNDEREILVELGNLKDILTYNFLFFQSPNPQVFEVICSIDDVLPSRISQIFQAKKDIEENPSFQEIFHNVKISKNNPQNIKFTFDDFRKFTPSVDSFLEIVDKTFKGVKFDAKLIISWMMNRIREMFRKENYLKQTVLQAFISILFFKKLGLFYNNNDIKEGGQIMNELKEKTESFFQKFPETFDHPCTKAVFLLGALTQKLLNIQYKERGSTPFRSHLKNLMMREDDFKGLLPKIQNKLEEYKKNYYRSLETIISMYFIESGQNWKRSIDELNYFFVLGMNLVDEISNYLTIKEEDENE
ncbi:MAG: CRISPR-associated protein, Csd1 family [Candidatus Kapaibacterium sp.]|nr:MAG: CRISPR-associated protein, Csd1 family [Candidatus Kapabacteria bacterium]